MKQRRIVKIPADRTLSFQSAGNRLFRYVTLHGKNNSTYSILLRYKLLSLGHRDAEMLQESAAAN